MKTEQLEFRDLYEKFNNRCEYICHTLLKDLNHYEFMDYFRLNIKSNQVECYGSDIHLVGRGEQYYDHFPYDFIYKSDEEILKWKNEILEKQSKEKEEKEKIKIQRELDCSYQRYLELKRKFENKYYG